MGSLRAVGVGVSAAGIVLLICRWALLPLIDEHDWVQTLALALMVGGALAARAIADEVSKGRMVIGGIAGAALAFGAFLLFIKPVDASQVTLVEKELPGFVLLVPDEAPSVDLASPAHGTWSVERIGKRKGLVQVSWQSGHTEISAEQLAEVMGLAAPNVGKSTSQAIEINGHEGKVMTFPLNDSAAYISVFYCEPHDRDYTLATMIVESRAKGLAFHKRIADGIECHIGEKPALEIQQPLVTLPPTYGYVEHSDPPTFRSLDGGELAFQPITPTVADRLDKTPALAIKIIEMVPGLTEVALEGTGPGKATATDGSERAMIRVRYKENGIQAYGTLTAIRCGDKQSFWALHSYLTLARQPAAENAMLSAVCPRGAKPKKHPTVQQMLGKACEAKDGRGCHNLGALAQLAKPPRLDEAMAHYRKGCDADHGPSCNGLGVLLAKEGKADEAKALFEKACHLGDAPGCENAGQ